MKNDVKQDKKQDEKKDEKIIAQIFEKLSKIKNINCVLILIKKGEIIG